MTRGVDLSGAGNATLSFVWGTYYLGLDAQIVLEAAAAAPAIYRRPIFTGFAAANSA